MGAKPTPDPKEWRTVGGAQAIGSVATSAAALNREPNELRISLWRARNLLMMDKVSA